MGFRFHTSRLVVGTCSSASIVYSRGFNPSVCASQGCSSTTYCGTGGTFSRSFYVNFYMYRPALYQNQWYAWSSGEYYDITFTFSSVSEDVDSDAHPDQLFITGTLIW